VHPGRKRKIRVRLDLRVWKTFRNRDGRPLAKAEIRQLETLLKKKGERAFIAALCAKRFLV
jgi:hypothetical protein